MKHLWGGGGCGACKARRPEPFICIPFWYLNRVRWPLRCDILDSFPSSLAVTISHFHLGSAKGSSAKQHHFIGAIPSLHTFPSL